MTSHFGYITEARFFTFIKNERKEQREIKVDEREEFFSKIYFFDRCPHTFINVKLISKPNLINNI